MKFFVNKILIFTFIFSLLSIGCRDKREGVAEGESNISEEIIGNSPSIEIIDPLLEEVINTRAKIEILTKEVFVWSEGPVWIQEHEMVLFTDRLSRSQRLYNKSGFDTVFDIFVFHSNHL